MPTFVFGTVLQTGFQASQEKETRSAVRDYLRPDEVDAMVQAARKTGAMGCAMRPLL